MKTTTCTAMITKNGTLKIEGAKTLGTYHRLFYENHPPMEGCFFAFNDKQFKEGYEQIKHLLGENEKIVSVGNGLYGKREYIDRFFNFYNDKNKLIREQCDPQEVYYYEWNDHEVCYSHDDEDVIKIIIDIWGADVAKTIKRRYATQTVDQILMYNLEKNIKGLHYINNGKPTTPRYVWIDPNGRAYTMIDARLLPVYQACGKQYTMNKKFADMTAWYDGKKLYKFHIE